MPEEKQFTQDQAHRFFGVEFNNAIFALAEKETLTEEEKERIIQLGHAALLHWQKFSGTKIVNTQRGLYMIAKAYVAAGEKENALKYAKICFKTTFENESEMADFDIGYAYEMMARTAAMCGDKANFETYYAKALAQKENIKLEGDLKYYAHDLEGGNWFEMI